MLANTHRHLGVLAETRGNWEEARRETARAQQIAFGLVKENPLSLELWEDFRGICNNMRFIFANKKDGLGAVRWLEATLSEFAELEGKLNPRAGFRQAREALVRETLKDAIDNGYRDSARLRESPAFAPFRQEEWFTDLLEKTGGK